MDHLSPEERAIVEAQQDQGATTRPLSTSTATVADLSPPRVAPTPNPIVPAPAAGAACTAPTDAVWTKVVETYGSHLTDEELQIIYRQLKEG